MNTSAQPRALHGRLPKSPADVTDCTRSVRFTFDGREYAAYEGDTIASALYAAGVRIFSRSFKYHRPRGLFCVAGHCPNCLVKVGDEPNVRACKRRVEEGMVVNHQNAWPSLDIDIMALTDKLDRFLPVGFYYKTFIRPRSLWPTYEAVLRHAAGLGVIDPDPDQPEPTFDKQYAHADVAVVGGGPAGLSAALVAAEAGARVMLIDENPSLGGHLRYQVRHYRLDGDLDGLPGYEIAQRLTADVQAHERIQVLHEATALGHYEDNWIGIEQGRRLIKLRTKQLVVATGCYEKPLLFQNNDLPGVFLGSGLQRLMHLYGIRVGQEAVVVSGNDDGLQIAEDLLQAGVQVAAVADARPADALAGSSVVDRLQEVGVTVLPEHTVVAAQGGGHVKAATIVRLAQGDRLVPGSQRQVECDLIAVSVGYTPANALLYQSGCRLAYDDAAAEILPVELAPSIHAAGQVTGVQDLEAILMQGRVAGIEEAAACGFGHVSEAVLAMGDRVRELRSVQKLRTIPLTDVPYDGTKKFVCYCEDVALKDIKQAIAEGFDDIETLKRYSTISMGPCQGKMCTMNAIELCARETDRTIQETGTTVSRPPYSPVTLGALAGRKLEPVRYTPMHERHIAAGAVMMNAGQWKRPEHYGDPHAEVLAVRNGVGIIDVSTLGKMLLRGPDVPKLLNRVYTNRWTNLPVGRARYGVMCNDEGIIIDDGVCARLGDEVYYMTTTTGGATAIYEWMQWWLQSGWNYKVRLVDVTETNAAINVTGPRSREVLSKLTDLDLSPEAFPYMHARQADVAGVPAWLFRLGFTGELGYEIHFPAAYGADMWDAVTEAGKEFDIHPFGIEAQRILRLEKMHILVGQDTDALSNPIEAGMAWAVKLDKDDFLGKPSLQAVDERGIRNRLVGFEAMDPQRIPEEGNQILRDGDGNGRIVGRVTSSRYSPVLNKAIGLCWVPADMAEAGTSVQIRVEGQIASAVVVRQPFYDPDGHKLRL